MKNRDDFKEFEKAFLRQNSYLNLISKNDEKFLWEKHIFDSIAIEKFFQKYCAAPDCGGKLKMESEKLYNFQLSTINFQLLDIGTGGGFPAVPIALSYPEIEVYALDSIRKKINAIENIKSELDIKNLHTICNRAENISGEYDLVTSRAVAPIKVIAGYALPLLKNDGYFVAYKSVKAQEEIVDAKNILKKYNAKVVDIIQYDLPLEENYTRNLIVIAKN
ncbi:16S rRNA (guanine(527)-N(7))-methyltransferase RsmG [bacterium]|nr:16S rRNA (guanine(527)-N(7))-methyltransferase RsmG [bacterium]